MPRAPGLARLATAISGLLLPLRAWAAREADWMRTWAGPASDL